MEAYIRRIKEVNPIVNAVVAERFEDAVKEAEEIDRILDSGDVPDKYSETNAPFLGIPFTAKEAFGVVGKFYTCLLLSGFIP